MGIAHNIENQTKPLQTLLRKFSNDWSMNLSAALAYNLLLAIFPLLVALLAVLGLLLGRFGGTATNFVLSALPSAFPNNLNPIVIITAVEQNLKHSSGLLGLIAVLSAIFGGSRLFIFLESCFCIIYRVRPRPFVRQNLMAIGMFLLFLLLVPIMVLASSVPALAFSLLHNTWLGRLPLLTTVAGFLGGLIASFILFEFIYVVVPNQDIRLGHGWLGAIVAAFALQLYVLIFPLYSSHFLIGVAGAVGLGAILIVFFYYFAVIMLLGAEVNSFFAEGVQPLPNDVATFVSTMGGRLNDDSPTDEAKAHVDSRPTEKADKEHVVDFVLETQEPDVPPRVAQDPKVQEEVLQRQRRGSSNTEMNE
ncbi:MAG: YihY/virulence factor BrkB family protein [Ktedonobacteraceae bacterium]|nr:YihY/virulence factor BrkB family protein [Ktedonobacteraceae bacterium]